MYLHNVYICLTNHSVDAYPHTGFPFQAPKYMSYLSILPEPLGQALPIPMECLIRINWYCSENSMS